MAFDEAIEEAAWLSLPATTRDLLGDRGRVLLELGRYDEARRAFEEQLGAATTVAGQALWRANLADVDAAESDSPQADAAVEAKYRECLGSLAAMWQSEYRAKLAELFRRRDPGQAATVLRPLRAGFRADEALRTFALGLVYLQQGRFQDAGLRLAEAAEIDLARQRHAVAFWHGVQALAVGDPESQAAGRFAVARARCKEVLAWGAAVDVQVVLALLEVVETGVVPPPLPSWPRGVQRRLALDAALVGQLVSAPGEPG